MTDQPSIPHSFFISTLSIHEHLPQPTPPSPTHYPSLPHLPLPYLPLPPPHH